jgi:sulfite reductase alpha subunit
MVVHPRTNSYVRTDDWDDEAEKWRNRQTAGEAAE